MDFLSLPSSLLIPLHAKLYIYVIAKKKNNINSGRVAKKNRRFVTSNR